MNVDELKTSRFLKKEDCDPPITVTIDHVEKQNLAEPGAVPELKWCLFFRYGIKPMVLNATNGQLIARLLGSKNSDDWTGKRIGLRNDPNVSFAGELVGGIRVCAPPMMRVHKPEPMTQPTGKSLEEINRELAEEIS